MTTPNNPFITRSYLRSVLDREFRTYRETGEDERVLALLKAWDGRDTRDEAADESAFEQRFFVNLWGYEQSGGPQDGAVHTIRPKYHVRDGGEGGDGYADLALGWFGRESIPSTPQVLVEFEDIRSDLDAS